MTLATPDHAPTPTRTPAAARRPTLSATTHPLDAGIGQRLRAARKAAGASQTDLASAIGVTFQQLQKYERGSNRVSASALVLLAQALGVAPTIFLDGLVAEPAESDASRALAAGQAAARDLAMRPHGQRLAVAACRLHGAKRAALADVAEAMVAGSGSNSGVAQ